MTKTTEIPVHCWHCGEQFYIEIANVTAGKLFCSDKCREDNLKDEIKMKRDKVEVIKHQALLNNCVDDDEAILRKRETEKNKIRRID